MKKTIKITALTIVVVLAVFALVACGKTLSGEYVDAITNNVTYEFSGKNYTKTTDNIIGADTVVEGKYEIDEDAGTITFTYEVDGEEKTQTENFVEGTEGDVEYIKIGIVKFNKK